MKDARSFAVILTQILMGQTLMPENIERISKRLVESADKYNQNLFTTTNLWVAEESIASYERYTGRGTFRGHFSESSKGQSQVQAGWQTTDSRTFISEEEGHFSISSSSYQSHDLGWGDRYESSSETLTISKDSAQSFETPFKIGGRKNLALLCYNQHNRWEVILPANGSIDEVQLLQWNWKYTGGGNYKYEKLEFPLFKTQSAALKWALQNEYNNTPWSTKEYWVIRCKREELDKALFIVGKTHKSAEVDNYLFLPHEGQPKMEKLHETEYPTHVDSQIQEVNYIYLDKEYSSTTGWGFHESSYSSTECEEVKLPNNHHRKPNFTIRSVTPDQYIQFPKDLYITVCQDGKFRDQKGLPEKWEKLVIIERTWPYKDEPVVVAFPKAHPHATVLETILNQEELYPWMKDYKDTMMGIFSLKWDDLGEIILENYNYKLSRTYGRKVRKGLPFEWKFSQEELLEALGFPVTE